MVTLIFTISSWFISPYLSGIGIIILGTLLLSYAISQDAAKHLMPILEVYLAPDQRTVIIENNGTAPAREVRVTLIPSDHRYEAGDLLPDTKNKKTTPDLLTTGAAHLSWKGVNGEDHEKTFRFSPREDDEDPFQPMFPLFSWKGKK